MKAKKLVSLALPIMLLGGCGADTGADKPSTKVEAKQDKKEVLSKDKYLVKINDLAMELTQKITEITDMAMDKSNDEKTFAKEFVKQEADLQKTIKKFNSFEPPKEFKDAHKGILKAVDCYSKAYQTQAQELVKKEPDQTKLKESMELVKQGKDYWTTGMKPIQKAEDDLQSSTRSKDKTELAKDSIKVSENGKELVGEWGSYSGSTFNVGLDFRSDGKYSAFDDTGKTTHEQNHIYGEWIYNADTNKLTLDASEYVKDGKKYDKDDLRVSIKFSVKSIKGDTLTLVDEKGQEQVLQKRK
ncbi:hypothetical protein WAZ07_16850 [Bacillus sp. FJAT-51639]|uniref:DUF3994 domain-containing protein n=1 Tax=Bacillus bruguierae TaxID=3127667 RepID=A0ABU8FJT1_9BACI